MSRANLLSYVPTCGVISGLGASLSEFSIISSAQKAVEIQLLIAAGTWRDLNGMAELMTDAENDGTKVVGMPVADLDKLLARMQLYGARGTSVHMSYENGSEMRLSGDVGVMITDQRLY